MSKNPIIKFFIGLYNFVRGFIFLVGFLVVLGVILTVFKFNSASFESPSYDPKDKIFLHFKLDGNFLAKAPDLGSMQAYFKRVFAGDMHEYYVPHLRDILKHAKNDPQVLGLALELKGLGGSLAEFAEFRKILVDFKSSGKTIQLWSSELDNKGFFLASAADKIQLAPEGQIFAPGPMFQLIYAGDFFRKLGVGFDVIRAGQFKSAFEPLVSNDPSPETQKAYSAVEESLRKFIVSEIAQGRKVDLSKADGWLRRSLFTSKEALAEKMIDGLSYGEAFAEKLEETGKLIDFEDYHPSKKSAKSLKDKVFTGGEGIALIEVVGEMFIEHSEMLDKNAFDFDLIQEELQWAREDSEVKAVVLRIDSPGGSSLAADLLWDSVRRLAEAKPVVVSMGAYAASGGYYMAAPAAKILAQPVTITGSIGVIGLVPNFEEFRNKYGVSFHLISGTDRRQLLNHGSRLSDDDRMIMDHHVRGTYETFINRVATGRKKTFAQVDEVAQGRVWTGLQAKDLGLVDEIGGITEAFHVAKQLSKLNVEKEYPVLRYEAPTRSLRQCLKKGGLFSCLSLDSATRLSLPLASLPWAEVLSRWITKEPKEKILTILPDQLIIR